MENDYGIEGPGAWGKRREGAGNIVTPATGPSTWKEGGGGERSAAPGGAKDQQYNLDIFGAGTTRRSTSTTWTRGSTRVGSVYSISGSWGTWTAPSQRGQRNDAFENPTFAEVLAGGKYKQARRSAGGPAAGGGRRNAVVDSTK